MLLKYVLKVRAHYRAVCVIGTKMFRLILTSQMYKNYFKLSKLG
jgi:hypothetical protein